MKLNIKNFAYTLLCVLLVFSTIGAEVTHSFNSNPNLSVNSILEAANKEIRDNLGGHAGNLIYPKSLRIGTKDHSINEDYLNMDLGDIGLEVEEITGAAYNTTKFSKIVYGEPFDTEVDGQHRYLGLSVSGTPVTNPNFPDEFSDFEGNLINRGGGFNLVHKPYRHVDDDTLRPIFRTEEINNAYRSDDVIIDEFGIWRLSLRKSINISAALGINLRYPDRAPPRGSSFNFDWLSHMSVTSPPTEYTWGTAVIAWSAPSGGFRYQTIELFPLSWVHTFAFQRLTFSVLDKDTNAPIQDALIEIDGRTLVTDNTGFAMTSVRIENTYNYTASHSDYKSSTGTINMESSGKTRVIYLEKEKVAVPLLGDFEIPQDYLSKSFNNVDFSFGSGEAVELSISPNLSKEKGGLVWLPTLNI